MPSLRVPPGVVRGETRASVPGRWYDVNQVRWHEGAMTSIGGWARLNPTPFGSVPRAALTWQDTEFYRHSLYLCDGHAYHESNNVFTDITPDDFANAEIVASRGYGSGNYGLKNYGQDDEDRGSGIGQDGSATEKTRLAVKFSIDNWNDEALFLSSADGRTFVFDPVNPDQDAVLAPNVPNFCQALVVTEEAHLMVFGADGIPNRVAWSDQENREGWDYEDTTGEAGFRDLEGGGAILNAVKIPGGVVIFTTTSVWLCRYVGAPYFYGFNRINIGAVPVSAHAIAVSGNRVIWLTKNSFWKYEGGVAAPLPCALGPDIFSEINFSMSKRVSAGANSSFQEVWFLYPWKGQNAEGNDVENDRYVVYNFQDNWWAPGYIGRSFFYDSTVDKFPIAGNKDRNVFAHEQGFLDEGHTRVGSIWAEIGTVSYADADYNVTVTQAQVDKKDGGLTRFNFRGNLARGGGEIDFGYFTPRADGYMDSMFTARDFIFRVEPIVDAQWSLGAINFTVKPRGKR